MEIQQTYRMLKYQEALYKKELDIKKKELQEISTEKQNITIKKIHGELYYYAQQRKDGKVKSRYLSPVIPGKIADIENIQLRIEHLSNEIQDLEWDIMTASKMLACYEKRTKKENFMDEFTFEVSEKIKKDTILSIYQGSTITSIIETSKLGLEQRQEALCIPR